MDFFKTILSDDPEPEILDNYEKSETVSPLNHQDIDRVEDGHSNSDSTSSGDVGSGGGLWSFGDLVKTSTTRSESVLETYRRDLKEFGSGLRKESDMFREVASRAMKELPSTIEVGASSIDGVLKSTADVISQGKDALLEPSDVNNSDGSEAEQNYNDRSGVNSRGYSRFDSQLNVIQTDFRTYCEDPEDLDDYSKWKSGFVLGDKKSEIEELIGDDGGLEAIHEKLVPDEVDDESFWCRYFYRVHKLKQQEDVRANLVRRSLTVDDDEELSWDVDEEEEDEAGQLKKDLPEIEKKQGSNNGGGDVCDGKVESVPRSDENLDDGESAGKDGEVLGVSAQEEEDVEWDEIEDLGDDDEKKVSEVDTPNKAGLLRRLNAGEADEDLSWDIEDNDEPVKSL